jgi:hypothetical protein
LQRTPNYRDERQGANRRAYFGAIMPRALLSFTADLLDQQNVKFFRVQESARKFAQGFNQFGEFADHPS